MTEARSRPGLSAYAISRHPVPLAAVPLLAGVSQILMRHKADGVAAGDGPWAAAVVSLVVRLDIGEVKADHIPGVARAGVVDEEPDAFAGADAAQSFGHDVGIAEGVGDAGIVVADQVGTRLGAVSGRGRAVASDVPETLTPGES